MKIDNYMLYNLTDRRGQIMLSSLLYPEAERIAEQRNWIIEEITEEDYFNVQGN